MSLHSTAHDHNERRGGLDNLNHVRSLKETAKLLNVSVSTLKRRIDDGSVKVVRLSARRVGVTDREREDFIRACST
jgi:hypothetical protein